MTGWLLLRTIRRAPRRTLLEAVGVAFPVAILAATLLFVDQAVQSMTTLSLQPVLLEMRAIGKSLDVDMGSVSAHWARVPGVRFAEPFAAANVVVDPGTGHAYSARLFAVDPAYLTAHPWVRVMNGGLDGGVLLDQSLRATPGFDHATTLTIDLPGDAPPLGLTVPVGGTVDLRGALPWFAVPYGEVQGDIVGVPRSLVIDRATFDNEVLPVLQGWAAVGGLPPFDPGAGELPSATIESHVTVDHGAYPPDPGQAMVWSGQLQRSLSRQADAPVVVADDAVELLAVSEADATNAKILFLLLGIPGVLVAGGLGLAVTSTLAEAVRREEALLRLRGANTGQIVRLATAGAVVAGVLGSALGLTVAMTVVTAITGRPAWEGVPLEALALSLGLALAAGAFVVLVRIHGLRRAGRRADEAAERRLTELGWMPLWRRARLDIIAIVAGLAILAVSTVAGGLQPSLSEGPALALSFYVMLAPILLWIGVTLLLIRVLLAALAAVTRPERASPLASWRRASLRWFGRRPARTAVSLSLAALAVGFGTLVLSFDATYDAAKAADARAAMGADLRLTPADQRLRLPALGPEYAAVSAVRLVPSRVDADRKTVLALDLASYLATAAAPPIMVAGEGPEALSRYPDGILVDLETAQTFEVGPGDTLPVTIYPDDFENAADLELRVVGVYSSFPPTSPPAELVTTVGALPRAELMPADFYLARVASGHAPTDVAAAARTGPLAGTFGVVTSVDREQRGLTALNVAGLSAIEALGSGLIAAVGLAVLGAFLILERHREIAILRTIGADDRQVLTGPAIETSVAVIGSLLIGVPVGLGLGFLAVRVLGLFFAQPPPLLVVPLVPLAGLIGGVVVTSVLALTLTLFRLDRERVAAVLRGA